MDVVPSHITPKEEATHDPRSGYRYVPSVPRNLSANPLRRRKERAKEKERKGKTRLWLRQ
jgi:hypothetical protein